MRMTFYTANCRGNAKNNLYPNKRVVDNEDDSLEVMAFDHVCGEFKDFRRSGENFLSSDVEVMDCDNDHSDAPEVGFIQRIWKVCWGRMWLSLPYRAEII